MNLSDDERFQIRQTLAKLIKALDSEDETETRTEKRQRHTVYLPEPVSRLLKVTAAETGYEISEIVENALRRELRI